MRGGLEFSGAVPPDSAVNYAEIVASAEVVEDDEPTDLEEEKAKGLPVDAIVDEQYELTATRLSEAPTVAAAAVARTIETDPLVTLSDEPDEAIIHDATDGAEPSEAAEKAPPLQTGEDGGSGRPPESGPQPSSDADDAEGEGTERQIESEYVDLPEADRHFHELVDGLMVQSTALQGTEARFKIVAHEQGPQAIIFYDQPTNGIERVAFAFATPEEKLPADALDETGFAGLNESPFTGQHIINELAKIAPNPRAIDKLTDVFSAWLDSPYLEADALQMTSRHVEADDATAKARAEGDARIFGAKAILFGAMRQHDIAKAEGDTVDLARMVSPAVEELLAHSPKQTNVRNSIAHSLERAITGKEARNSIESDWKGKVSKEALCLMTATVTSRKYFPEVLLKSAVDSGLALKDPDLAAAVSAALKSDAGPKIIKKAGEPQAMVERYMQKLLIAYEQAPNRNARVISEALENQKPNQPLDRFPTINMLRVANALADAQGRARLSLHDMTLAGEGLRFFLQATRSTRQVIAETQLREDTAHAEIVEALAAQIVQSAG
ncbi:MAG TPA: hypothetical protein VLF60_04905 [Candidatus Saccharimonadales bacterium]|nr:hypothetical protein [Candidatus Saccharimonadales bacterium]